MQKQIQNINMHNINLKVAFCNLYTGYRSSMATSEIDNNHTDVVDHYFYHGAPWFTFDKHIFSQISSQKNIVVKEVTLSDHREDDRNYCKCPHAATNVAVVTPKAEIRKDKVSTDLSDAEYYFRDVYHLASMFH